MSRVYWLETKSEFLKLVRMRAYAISTVAFPLMFYSFFGLAMGTSPRGGTMPLAKYLLATYGAFSIVAAALYAFGVGVATERGLGWLQVKRASPMPMPAYFVAKGAVAAAFGAATVALLFTMGAAFGDVRMPATQWLSLGGVLIAGSLPFCALGLAIGAFAGPNSAPATVNLIYMPLAFCAGLWIPIDFLPAGIKQIAPFLPTYHFGQIALAMLNAPTQGTVGEHAGALLGFGLIFAGIAWVGNARAGEKMYG
jgi:ABC-2 type transport system permease protein